MPSCAICNFEAPSEKHLRVHIESKHDDRVLTCEKCEKTCIGGRKLKTHMESHREVTCKHCENKIPYNSRSQRKKPMSLTSAISDAWKIHDVFLVFNLKSSLVKKS